MSGTDGYAARVPSPAVENLVTQLSKLPGIGRRTAQRLTFHLLSARAEDALELARAIEDVKARVRFCRECGNLTEEDLCEVCSDARRDRTVICVVEQPVDVVSLERTHEFRGLYHVLGGALMYIGANHGEALLGLGEFAQLFIIAIGAIVDNRIASKG